MCIYIYIYIYIYICETLARARPDGLRSGRAAAPCIQQKEIWPGTNLYIYICIHTLHIYIYIYIIIAITIIIIIIIITGTKAATRLLASRSAASALCMCHWVLASASKVDQQILLLYDYSKVTTTTIIIRGTKAATRVLCK